MVGNCWVANGNQKGKLSYRHQLSLISGWTENWSLGSNTGILALQAGGPSQLMGEALGISNPSKEVKNYRQNNGQNNGQNTDGLHPYGAAQELPSTIDRPSPTVVPTIDQHQRGGGVLARTDIPVCYIDARKEKWPLLRGMMFWVSTSIVQHSGAGYGQQMTPSTPRRSEESLNKMGIASQEARLPKKPGRRRAGAPGRPRGASW